MNQKWLFWTACIYHKQISSLGEILADKLHFLFVPFHAPASSGIQMSFIVSNFSAVKIQHKDRNYLRKNACCFRPSSYLLPLRRDGHMGMSEPKCVAVLFDNH